MSATCDVCESDLTYDGDCDWCDLERLRVVADVLAAAVEVALNGDMVWGRVPLYKAWTEYRKIRPVGPKE